MAAGVYNIIVEKGSTFELPVTVTMVLTGYSARMQIKDKVGGTSTADLTTANGGLTISVGSTDSTITVLIPAATSAAWADTFVKGVYDLEIVAPSGRVTRLLKGSVAVDPEVTTIA